MSQNNNGREVVEFSYGRSRPGPPLQTRRSAVLIKLTIGFLAAVFVVAAQAPLPELRVEAADDGSVIYLRNVYPQPITAFLIELVDYPGSSFSHWQDNNGSGLISPGVETRFPVRSKLVGAVPDYVKVQAVLYADGNSGGIRAKIAELIARRRSTLETDRELIRRFEKARSNGTSQSSLIGELKEWAAGLPLAQVAARTAISSALVRLDQHSIEDTLADLRSAEKSLTSSKPALD